MMNSHRFIDFLMTVGVNSAIIRQVCEPPEAPFSLFTANPPPPAHTPAIALAPPAPHPAHCAFNPHLASPHDSHPNSLMSLSLDGRIVGEMVSALKGI